MRKLQNPNNSDQEKLCFACSPHNEIGLQMEFFEDGDKIISTWNPSPRYQGFDNVLHGGIQATLIDEIAAWSVFIKGKTAGVTQNITIEYLKPVYINKGSIKLIAQYNQIDSKHAQIQVALQNANNEIAARGKVTYRLYPPKLARKKLNYKGLEAYYPAD